MIRSKEFRNALRQMITGRIFFDEPMCRYTAIGVGGKADALVFPSSVEELKGLVSILSARGIPYIPVGNFTNLIFRDGGFRGAVICMKELQKLDSKERGDGLTSIYAEAGVKLSRMVDFTLERSLSGMEFCAGIPGSVGGAVRMNAGAYGNEIKDTVHNVFIMNNEGDVLDLSARGLIFEYRNLSLEEGDLVVAATFLLKRGDREEMKTAISSTIKKRRNRHPLQYKNAGSIFKNPPDKPAGRIIDELGLKGTRIGDAMVSTQHGNFIVNTGAARARDIISVMETVRDRVLDLTGVTLEPEVKIVGEE